MFQFSLEDFSMIVQENLELIELFKRLRVTDVRDGMDWMG
jgi:hypothetical protein